MVHIDRVKKVSNIKRTFKSKLQFNHCGVPQGNVMASLLYVTGIYDLIKIKFMKL